MDSPNPPDDHPPVDPTILHRELPGALPAEADMTLVEASGAARLLGAPDLTRVPGAADSAPDPQTGDALDMTRVGGDEGPPVSPRERKVLSTRFEVLGVLGHGGMGKVYRVRDLQIEGRQVALKVLHPRYSQNARFRELFFQEIRAAQGFVSPHTVQIRDTGQMEDGSLFLTMDLVAGESLARKLGREGSLAVSQAFEVARQILLGLQSGHEQGLVHRDVKPSNVMLAARVAKTPNNPFGVGVRLLDFGIAGLVKEQNGDVPGGTPRYMSPEQVQGQRLDARSDLFAVGVVLFEMIVGVRPFGGSTLQAIERSILETQIEPIVGQLKDLPRAAKRILIKALSKDRETRYQSASEFLRALKRARVSRPNGRMGVLPRVTLALLGLVAGAEAVVVVDQRGELRELRDELGGLQGGNVEELAALSLQVAAKETELSRIRERLAEEGDAGTRFVDLQRDYDKLSAENATLQRRNEDLSRRLADLGNVRFDELPSSRTAACFDEVLKRIDHGAGRSALELLNERAGQGVFTLDGVDGRALVRSLASCAAALESAERKDGIDLRRLDEAGALLEEIRAQRQRFLVEAASWLDVTPKGANPADRKTNLAATIWGLQRRYEDLCEHGASAQENAWSEVAAGPDDQDPDAAFAYAELYGVEAITELVVRYGAHLERTVCADGGLDVDRLAASTALSRWSEWLAGPGAALDDGAANTIREFACAWSWYVDRDSHPVFAELFGRLPEIATGDPHDDWRARLALQLALERSGAYPPSPESVTVMRHTWSQSGSTMWFVERLQERTADGWRVERRIHDATGEGTGRPQSYTLTRLGDVYFVEGTQALDLRSAEPGVRVGALRVGRAESLPRKPWVRELDLDGYRKAAGSEPIPCLVVQTSSTEAWFSPRFGLVRESRPGIYEREQVFTSAFR